MKRVLVAISLTLTIGLSVNAQSDSFFSYADTENTNRSEGSFSVMPRIPIHGQEEHQSAPLSSGLLILTGLGAVYAMKKKND